MTGRDEGFTLIEALIAAAVLAGISLLLAPALVGAVNAAGRSHAFTDRIERQAALDGVLHELFASTHQPPRGDDGLNFAGGPNAAAFLVRPAGGEMQRAQLGLDEAALTLRISPITAAEAASSDAEPEIVLAEGFESGRLSYIGLDRARWRRVEQVQWTGERPPRLVIVHLDWPDGTRTRIQAAVAGEGRFECRFDSGRGLCLGDSY